MLFPTSVPDISWHCYEPGGCGMFRQHAYGCPGAPECQRMNGFWMNLQSCMTTTLSP
jgi:hypothetical protein